MAFDFNARTNPMQGLSMQDLVASKQSPLTTLAQSGPAMLEALRRRRQMNERAQAEQGMAKAFASGDANNIDPNVLQGALRSGLISIPDLMEIRTKGDAAKSKSELDKANIEYKKQQARQIQTILDNGYIPQYDQLGNVVGVLPIKKLPGAEGAGPGPAALIPGIQKPSVAKEGDPLKQAIADLIKDGSLGKSESKEKPNSQPPKAPPGFKTQYSPKEGKYYFRNLTTDKLLPAPSGKK